ncbi:helix-turn-helix domain-containing protein [Halorubrum ezzemoulense]|uniref:helix-turn-helix domain-containing protein n=1 Tax=Halorubrum ezzemoulense TaxID=337243 RepID=UPI00232E617C|nr:helix-turn-helix domain-containing protein [Halorubrum ezzemoulense]MDB9281432.1 helix-turn-helix domain-containing protein [Halorubrum ezzemoulense]MDB9284896.1 helix-turn-helix domain-containing protein [Halorubrum ezzemoulense]
MATVAEFTTRSSQFPIGKVFAEYPMVNVEVERIKQTETSIVLYFWLITESTPPSDSELTDNDIFSSVELLDTLPDESLYSARLKSDRESIFVGITNATVNLEEAKLTGTEWMFRLRVESAEQLSTFQSYCQENDFSVRLTRFPTQIQIFNGREYNLTEKQYEALTLAYSEGYFDKPRKTTLEELGETLGVTRQAVLARLQNGEKNILENTIVRSVNSEARSQ